MTFGVLYQPHLVRSGGTIHILVTWHTSTGGIQCFIHVSFGFPADFQFFMPNSIKLFAFSLSSLLSPICAIIALCSSSQNFLSCFPFLGLFLLRYNFFPHALFFVVNFTGKRLLVFSFSCFGIWSPPPPTHFFLLLGSMVDSYEVRRLCPSLSFFFVRLRPFLGSSRSFGTSIEGFVFGGSGLGLALADVLVS